MDLNRTCGKDNIACVSKVMPGRQNGRPLDHVQRLRRRGYLSEGHVEAAQEIRRFAEQSIRRQSGTTPVDKPDRLNETASRAYRDHWSVWVKCWSDGEIRWYRRENGHRRNIVYTRQSCLSAVLDVLLGCETMAAIEQRHGLRSGHGKLVTKLLLSHYGELMGLFPAGLLDKWTGRHAGIAR